MFPSPIEALSASDGMERLAVCDPPAYAGGFYFDCPVAYPNDRGWPVASSTESQRSPSGAT